MHQIFRSEPRQQFELAITYFGDAKPEVRVYQTLNDLGLAAYWLQVYQGTKIKGLEASSTLGRIFAIAELCAAAARRVAEGYELREFIRLYGSTAAPVYRGAPVPHTRKRRSYGRSYLRQPRTQAERRLNSLALPEEGEPAARARRRAHALPSAWDDIPREFPRGWKDQHKGRKSWDVAPR